VVLLSCLGRCTARSFVFVVQMNSRSGVSLVTMPVVVVRGASKQHLERRDASCPVKINMLQKNAILLLSALKCQTLWREKLIERCVDRCVSRSKEYVRPLPCHKRKRPGAPLADLLPTPMLIFLNVQSFQGK
jgi:hypothetical protein